MADTHPSTPASQSTFGTTPTDNRPNIVYLLTDDQRFDTIQALGNPHIHTPNLDGLVRRGTAFTQATISGGTHGAVCMPSRAMIHTGRRPFSFPDHGRTLQSNHTLLGQHLRNHGYNTYGIGKWHNGPEAFARSFSGGAEIFFGGMWDHWNVPAYHYQPNGRYDESVPYVTDAFHSNEVTWQLSDHVTPGTHSTDLFADAACRYLATRSKEPFFLYVAFMAPHDPRTMPRHYRDRYRDADMPLPAAFSAEYPMDYGVAAIRDELLAAYPRTEDDARRHLADYYGMITHLDDAIGRIMKTLRETGEEKNTIVVVAGDNGLGLAHHGLYGKQSCFDHSVRVPLIIAGPGIVEGAVRDRPCYLFDTFPTLCELVGIEPPATVEGESLVPTIRGRADDDGYPVYHLYSHLARAVRTPTHKLIEYAVDGVRTTLLFDLHADPDETSNVADVPSHAPLIRELRGMMVRFRDEWSELSHPEGREFWRQIERWTLPV